MQTPCLICKHYHLESEGVSCDAFPESIPDEIVEGQVTHDRPYDGDHGLVFEMMSEHEKGHTKREVLR